jgi:Protein of unknown function (DUF4058)
MKSPFPGMDPYLERHWGDIHTSLVTYARDQLQKVLPGDLRARVEERVVVSHWDRSRSLFPDVRVIETVRVSRRAGNGGTSIAVAEPLVIELPDEQETQRFIEIREVSSAARLVTVIEVLSPTNKKPGDGQEQYLRKQQELRQAGVSLVEIDLLRDGDWIVAVPIDVLEPKVRTAYRVVVRRGWRRLQAEYYGIALTERLPKIKVPLRPTNSDVPLDLQALLDQCYENGGYDDIDYTRSPEPPLPPATARWAAQLLRRTGRRRSRRRKS